jgi:CHASE2 domain-containing sensor protein
MKVTIWNGEYPGAAIGTGDQLTLPSSEQFRKAVKFELPMTLHGAHGEIIYLGNPRADEATLLSRVPISRALTELGGYSLATPGLRDLINFYGAAGAVPRVSLYKLATTPSPEVLNALTDKVVLMGHQSKFFGRGTLSKDEFLTPASSDGTFGVEIHATTVGNLLDRSWLRRADLGVELLVLGILVFSMCAYSLRSPSSLLVGSLWGVVLLLHVAAYLSFSRLYFWMSGLGTLTLVTAAVTAISALYLFRRAEAYKRYLEKTFSFEREREL